MPRSLLPLHVFEPRYRRLIQHCLQTDKLLGIATLKPGYEDDYHGTPAVWPQIGIGEIVAHKGLPDGRSNIVVRYVARGRLVREVPSEDLFRRMQVDPVPDVGEPSEVDYVAIRSMLLQFGARAGAGDLAQRLVTLDGSELVDDLAQQLLVEPEERRHYLGTANVLERREMVESRIAAALAGGAAIAEA